MNSITATYPGFQALPKGIKQMLLISESVFFEEARTTQTVSSKKTFNTQHSTTNSPRTGAALIEVGR
jgi:hypothetical protein